MHCKAGLISLALLGSAPLSAGAPRYFPLDPGNVWNYVGEENPAAQQKVFVVRMEDGLTVVSFHEMEVRIEDRGNELDIDLLDIGLLPYYRFDQDTWVHRDFNGCDDELDLTVTSRTETVETPAGVFENCLRLEYGPGRCADAGTLAEWWAPDVGRVKWQEESILGLRTWVLQSFENGSSPAAFRRGDGDGDGGEQLSDAIFVLNSLFNGGEAPGCPDAADSNDDGRVDIGDPIALLGYLFLGTKAPPAPGPTTCGEDPTEDTLGPCVQGACEDS
jgi:hypothetical protein